MNNLPEVILEVWMPEPKSIIIAKETMQVLFPKQEVKEINFDIPRVRKMSLSEQSELNIFGNVSPYRTAMVPPLPWGNEQYYAKKNAIINDEQVKVYNNQIRRIYNAYIHLIDKNLIESGIVEVFRAGHNVKLKNITLNP